MMQKPDPNVISIADAGTTRYKQEGERVKWKEGRKNKRIEDRGNLHLYSNSGNGNNWDLFWLCMGLGCSS